MNRQQTADFRDGATDANAASDAPEQAEDQTSVEALAEARVPTWRDPRRQHDDQAATPQQ